jgi:hypothetical protein
MQLLRPVRTEHTQEVPDTLLRVRRPLLTKCPAPPVSIATWLLPNWDDPGKTVPVAESRNLTDDEGQTITIRFDDDLDRVADLRRDRLDGSELVQPGWRRARHGILHRRPVPALPEGRSRPLTALVDEGIRLCKDWLAVDQQQQEERFAARAADPLKRWKLSPVDLEARTRYREYGRARDAMFRATHTAYAPWTVVRFDDQRRGRLNVIRHLVESVQYRQVTDAPVLLTPLDGAPAEERFAGPVKPIRGWY